MPDSSRVNAATLTVALMGEALDDDDRPHDYFVSLEPLDPEGHPTAYPDRDSAFALAWYLSLACRQPCEVRLDYTLIATITANYTVECDRELLAVNIALDFPHIDVDRIAPDLKPLLEKARQAGLFDPQPRQLSRKRSRCSRKRAG